MLIEYTLYPLLQLILLKYNKNIFCKLDSPSYHPNIFAKFHVDESLVYSANPKIPADESLVCRVYQIVMEARASSAVSNPNDM